MFSDPIFAFKNIIVVYYTHNFFAFYFPKKHDFEEDKGKYIMWTFRSRTGLVWHLALLLNCSVTLQKSLLGWNVKILHFIYYCKIGWLSLFIKIS